MSARTEYKIVTEYKLIVQHLIGDVYLQDIIDLKNRLVCDADYKSGYSIIVDIRYANLKISESDIDKYISFLSAESKLLDQGRSAILTNEPNQVAITTIFAERVSHMPASWGIFSTATAVLKWVNRPILSDCDFEKIIHKLKGEITENS